MSLSFGGSPPPPSFQELLKTVSKLSEDGKVRFGRVSGLVYSQDFEGTTHVKCYCNSGATFARLGARR